MDLVEAIRQRRSIRAFKRDPVPQSCLREIMELATRAPSWGNTQPWEFSIVGGEKLEEVKQECAKEALGQVKSCSDFPGARQHPEPYDSRRRTIGKLVFEAKGISRNDEEKRRWWSLQGLSLFGAPNVIYIYVDRSYCFQGDSQNVWPLFDCGLVAENIVLLSANYGLGTVVQAQAVSYPGVLRKTLGIPDSKLLVVGIAIGYPDWDDPVNQIGSTRELLDKVTKWCGFDAS